MKTKNIGKELRSHKLPNGYTLTWEDVGCYLDADFGPVLMSDVGKRIFLSGDIIQMENNEQKEKRLANG